MNLFYLLMECRNCDEEIYHGPVGTTLDHNGRLVIPFDIAAQTEFFCERCEASNVVGDLDDMVDTEGGRDPDELDDEDEGEEDA